MARRQRRGYYNGEEDDETLVGRNGMPPVVGRHHLLFSPTVLPRRKKYYFWSVPTVQFDSFCKFECTLKAKCCRCWPYHLLLVAIGVHAEIGVSV